MHRPSLGLLFALFLTAPVGATSNDYQVRIDVPGRRWHVEAVFPAAHGNVDFWIPRWQPGAYHLAEYGRFVELVQAESLQGDALVSEQVATGHYRIAVGDAPGLRVHYEGRSMSASGHSFDVLDVEANRINDRYAYLSPCSLLGFLDGQLDAACRLRVLAPPGWRTATALEADVEGYYTAPSYYRLEDSPLLFSPSLTSREFNAAGVPHTVTLLGVPGAAGEQLVQDIEKLSLAAHDLLGGFAFSRYEFLIGLVEESSAGAGLEHSESTLILASPLVAASDSLMDIIAHEYQHAWTAEAIQVESLFRPDYRVPLVTSTIWFNEGVTEYFRRHLQLHAGLLSEQHFWRSFSNDVAMLRMGMDALKQHSWTEVSRDSADFVSSMEKLMRFTSKFYQAGPVVILALDLEMRRASGGERGMVDLLRVLMREYPQKGRGFEEGTLFRHVNEVAGKDLDEFYRRYIDGREFPDLSSFLEVIGLEARGQLQRIRPLPQTTPAQDRARADFFSRSGTP